ncbi:MAG: glycosyltransferase, partial [Thiopseudomonas sp.]|nr:glycosyltransferase [Thiopseudomonas sp.]
PFGMVLLEAMAAGVPVIATDCGGAKEVVSDPECLFGLGDVGGLSAKLITGLESKVTIANVSQFTDSSVRHHFWSWLSNEYSGTN